MPPPIRHGCPISQSVRRPFFAFFASLEADLFVVSGGVASMQGAYALGSRVSATWFRCSFLFFLFRERERKSQRGKRNREGERKIHKEREKRKIKRIGIEIYERRY